MPAVEVICLLGKVRSPDEGVDVDVSEASGNSSKWIFDVTHDAGAAKSFKLQLLDNHGHVRDKGWFAPSFTPLNEAAAAAGLHVPEPNAPTVEFRCREDVTGELEYRVVIDAVHSSAR